MEFIGTVICPFFLGAFSLFDTSVENENFALIISRKWLVAENKWIKE